MPARVKSESSAELHLGFAAGDRVDGVEHVCAFEVDRVLRVGGRRSGEQEQHRAESKRSPQS